MNKFEKAELKHWKKESYRTLSEAEHDRDMKLGQAQWVDHAEYLGEVVAVVILSLVALSVGAYLLGL